MRKLGIAKAMVIGVSQGGMIAQHLAIDHSDLVEKLVLAVTLARQNPTVQQTLGKWIELAKLFPTRSCCKRFGARPFS